MNPITQAELDALRVGFELLFAKAYGNTPTFYDQICTTVPSRGGRNVYGWTAKRFRLRQWIGPRMAQNVSEHEQIVENLPFEGTFEINKDKLDDDRNTIDIYSSLDLPELAEAAAKHPDTLLIDRLRSNPTAFDGKAFFASDHPTYSDVPGTPATYDNDYDLELTADNVNTIWSAMTGFTGENGLPLGVVPGLLIHAPQKKRVVSEILASTTYAQSSGTGAGNVAVDNPMRGWMVPLMIPELADEPDTWYMADVSKPIKPWIFQRRSEAQLTARDQLTDSKVFDEKLITYGVDYRGNVAPALPFLMARSVYAGA